VRDDGEGAASGDFLGGRHGQTEQHTRRERGGKGEIEVSRFWAFAQGSGA
jgi:hypothetical protein